MRISDWSSDVCSSDLSDVRDDLRLVGTERLLECLQGRRVDVARRDELRRASRFATRKALIDLVAQAGIAEPFLDQWYVAGAVVVVIEFRAAIGRRSEEHTSELQ